MTFSIPSRFCGPPGSANGGYVAAKLAAHLSGPVRVRIQGAVPMDVDLSIEGGDDVVGLTADGTLLAQACFSCHRNLRELSNHLSLARDALR